MQLITLLPILALLAPLAQANKHDNSFERRVSGRHARYVEAADKAASAHMARREQLAQQHPRAVRKIRRGNGATGCRVKGAAFSASASNSTSSAVVASSTSATSAAAASVTSAAVVNSYNVQPSTSSAAAWSAPAAQSSAASSGGGSSNLPSTAGVTPNGKKAGGSGDDSVYLFGDATSWWWNYGPTPYTSDSSKIFVPTLWGNGQQGSQDSERLSAFQNLDYTPPYVQGFYEPDCSPPMSSAIDPLVAAPLWDSLIAPYKAKGSLLVSPGMCKQADEDWLTPFKNAISPDNMWDITSIHINKLDKAGALLDIDHYWNTYGKPIWVTEFACVDDQNGFTPSTDQGQINQFINDMVDLFENDSRIAAYSMSEGMGLGNVWPPVSNGQLTESGQTYLNAISKYN